jgi:hypothetical protein
MRIEETRGVIIEKLNEVEFLIDTILINYFNPKNKNDFSNNLLNSSIIEFGRKVKLISSLNLINKEMLNNLFRFSSIRNSFAHAEIKKVHHYGVDNEDLSFKSNGIEKMIVVMNSNGKIEKKYVSELFEEFEKLFEKIEKELNIVNINTANSSHNL